MHRTVLLMAALALPSVTLAGYEASSHKKDSRRGDFWNAASALDSKAETCWMVDPEEKNEGQWIQLDVPSSTIDKIGLVAGWDQDENTFFDYARIKKVRVDIFTMEGGAAKLVAQPELAVDDKRGWQILDLPDTKVGGDVTGGRIRVNVLETYPGKDYPNLAVSEIRVHLQEFPAQTVKVDAAPASAESGHDADLMVDGQPKTFWASTGEHTAEMSFKAPGYGLASIGVQSGPKPYARPKTVEVIANDMPVTLTLEDKPDLQWSLLPAIVGYTGSAWGGVTVKVLDAYPGDPGKGVAVSEVKLNAATIEDF